MRVGNSLSLFRTDPMSRVTDGESPRSETEAGPRAGQLLVDEFRKGVTRNVPNHFTQDPCVIAGDVLRGLRVSAI